MSGAGGGAAPPKPAEKPKGEGESKKESAKKVDEKPKAAPKQPRPAARMLFESSGRDGFELLRLPEDVKAPSRDVVERMLRRENELRLSAPVQRRLQDEGAGEAVYVELQKQVAREFGLEEEAGVAVIRAAVSLFGRDALAAADALPLYVKYNRAEQGPLKVGDAAPDVDLVALDGRACKLSALAPAAAAALPMVLVAVPALLRMAKDFEKRASFFAVYIQEAHAKDEWPVGEQVSFCEQPKTLEARLAVARHFVEAAQFDLPVVVDTMDNAFQKEYSAWPFRFYIVHNGRVALKAQPEAVSHHYEIEEIRQWLNDNTASA